MKKNNKINLLRYQTIYAIRIGLVFFPAFILLDYLVYPDLWVKMLPIRIGITIYLVITYFVVYRIKEKFLSLLITVSFLAAALAISLLCVVTGEGFASPYYTGIYQIVIALPLMVSLSTKNYTLIVVGMAVQHFILLSFFPGEFKQLMLNVFALGGFVIIGIIVHYRMSKFLKKIKFLEGMVPICAKCKKIRDDKGYWNKLENYMEAHSELEFTHGLCPECTKEFAENVKTPTERE